MSAETKRRFTLEEYLVLERESETRYEFWNGEVFAMSGGTLAHELTMTNCHDELSSHLTGRCLVFSSKMQIKVPSAPPYRYADGASCAAKRKSSGLTETTCF